jgi:DNA-binding XRE family transcriptional regulator
MQDVRIEINTFIEDTGLSQAELAKKAGVSQPTISRCIRNRRERFSSQCRKLVAYIRAHKRTSSRPNYTPGVNRVTNAFARIWDGSDAHARAIANVIDAMVDLRPADTRRGKRGEQRSTPPRTVKKHRPQ